MNDAERLLRELRDASITYEHVHGVSVGGRLEDARERLREAEAEADHYLSTLPRNPGLDAATVEACAKACDRIWEQDVGTAGAGSSAACAQAIRALVAEPAAPRLSRCSKHGGYGFVSDCTVCNEPATAAT